MCGIEALLCFYGECDKNHVFSRVYSAEGGLIIGLFMHKLS